MNEPQQALAESLEAIQIVLAFSIAHASEESTSEMTEFLRQLLLSSRSGTPSSCVYRAALAATEQHAKVLRQHA